MYQILEQIQTEVYTIGDTYTKVRVRLVCDTLSDLPGIHDISGLELQMGSTAHIVQTAQNMMMESNGTWREQTSSSIASLVNDISMLQSDVSALENRIGESENRITQLQAAAAGLIDRGAKNVLCMTGTSITGYGVSCVFDNVSGIITLNGINADKKCTGNFNVQVADPNNLDLIPGETYHFLCNGTSDATYGIYIYKSGAAPYPQFDCYTNNELPWNSEWNTSNGFRLFIRNGTVVDNVQLKPMITPLVFWQLSENFVPYAPTNAELYALIRSYHP